MNKLIALIFVIALFATLACSEKKGEDNAVSADAQLKEGVHYVALDRAEEKGKITEVFSVFCSVCYLYESGVIPKLKASLPADVVFEEAHVMVLGGSYGPIAHDVLAVALSQSPEQYQAAKQVYFDRNYGTEKAKIKDDEEAAMIGLEAAGISQEQYAELQGTPEVQAILDTWADALDPAIKGTPTLIVNNRYMILTEKIENQAELNRIVNELLKK
ncbi:MAG: DsbA family protein [Deferribacteraceae bacterium]|nr:DsbA family protein [Deferribacteraceae bacterium]